MNFTVIDWIFGVLIVIFAISGLAKGFVESLFNKLSWIGGIIAGCIFYDDVATNILKTVENQVLANVLAFIIIFVVVFLIIKCVQIIISRIFELNILNSLNRVLGFAFGIIEGLAVVALLIFLLDAQPFFDASKMFNGSFFYGIVSTLFLSHKELRTNV